MTTEFTPRMTEQEIKLEKIRLLEIKARERAKLPHLYAHKRYKWQREFFESTNKVCLLTAANQIGKSTIQICRVIEWCTNKKLWPSLWPGQNPNLGWYLYPSKDVASTEWVTKWIPLMPDKDDPELGWKEERQSGRISAIRFNTGFLLMFKTYSMDTQHLQTGTLYFIACDEELPVEHYDELMFRISASDGYFSMVFTATLGQDFWRQAMEPKTAEEERFPDAFKMCVSLYNCMLYEDGTPSHWTADKISSRVARCATHNEVLKRIYGRFVVTDGRKYSAYNAIENMKPPHPIPANWKVYVGIDSGSGGENNDPAAIVFVGVAPKAREARVFLAWRGDGIETTSSDIIKKYLSLRGSMVIEQVVYDYGDKDLHTIANRMGMSFLKANKNHEVGEGIVNTLFKNKMLYLYETGDVLKLSQELASLLNTLPNKGPARKMDHLCDALRYVCAKIPWDWTGIGQVEHVKPDVVKAPPTHALRTRGDPIEPITDEEYSIEEEIDEFNAGLECS